MACSLESHPALGAFLAGGPLTTDELARIPPAALKAWCDAERLWVLVHQRLAESGADSCWPSGLVAELGARARAEAATELLRAGEIQAVLAALAASGIRPVLLKGTALAYTIYPSPSARQRNDTDLLIAPEDVATARDVLSSLGYTFAIHCSDLFSQFEAQKIDRFGVLHVFDVHWSISTQPVFERVLTYNDVIARVETVPALGAHAKALGDVDALLLACVHPVMHHRNEKSVLWTYDVHLLAGRLSLEGWDEFARRARAGRVSAICRRQLNQAQTLLATKLPQQVLGRLSPAIEPEPSAAYLASERRWHDELVSSLRVQPSVGAGARLVRDILLPPRDYMFSLYGFRSNPLAVCLLPALYLHRNARGAWRVLTGKK